MATVLVVDDSDVVRETLSDVLCDAGHTVLLAEDYESAREQCDRGGIELIICDVMLPVRAGAKGRRGQPTTQTGMNTIPELALDFPTIPIVAFSGFLSLQDLEPLKRYGAVEVLTKPCPNDQLLSAVNHALERHASH